ncbi:MAG: SlyX family protein [Myxococcales bacterium]|nr:SlyX family protein [Myxococcales bacterium]
MTQDEETALHRRVRELEARVTELEVAAAFDRQTREALDEVVREFAMRVEILERKLAELVGQVGGLEIGDEPPPE